jgi:hypothetical protein
MDWVHEAMNHVHEPVHGPLRGPGGAARRRAAEGHIHCVGGALPWGKDSLGLGGHLEAVVWRQSGRKAAVGDGGGKTKSGDGRSLLWWTKPDGVHASRFTELRAIPALGPRRPGGAGAWPPASTCTGKATTMGKLQNAVARSGRERGWRLTNFAARTRSRDGGLRWHREPGRGGNGGQQTGSLVRSMKKEKEGWNPAGGWLVLKTLRRGGASCGRGARGRGGSRRQRLCSGGDAT